MKSFSTASDSVFTLCYSALGGYSRFMKDYYIPGEQPVTFTKLEDGNIMYSSA